MLAEIGELKKQQSNLSRRDNEDNMSMLSVSTIFTNRN